MPLRLFYEQTVKAHLRHIVDKLEGSDRAHCHCHQARLFGKSMGRPTTNVRLERQPWSHI